MVSMLFLNTKMPYALAFACAVTLSLTSTATQAGDWSRPFKKGGPLSINKPFDSGGGLSVGKPFDSGGDLSIDKPFDHGGSLSIDKPFTEGGSLSIGKVYVPKELQIGKAKSIAEVVFPVCWGSPQDCRDKPEGKEALKNVGKLFAQKYQYYITARYECSNTETKRRSGRLCDITKASNESCADALDALTWATNEETFDPCTTCSGVYDASAFWDGVPPQHVQYGGMCQGW